MITRYEHKGLRWIDVESPTKEDIDALAAEFSLHPLVAGELLAPSLRPKVDLYKDSIYLMLQFPAFRHSHGKDVRQEVDFVIGKNYLLTVHYDMIDAIHKFSKEFEVSSILDKSEAGSHAGYLFFHLIKKLYHSLSHELEHIDTRLENAEAKIFKGGEAKMVEVLSYINRDLLDFKQALRTHKDVLKSLEAAGMEFFGKDFSYYLQAISGEFYKVANTLDGHKETLIDLRETNDSLLTTKTGNIMKRLTFVSFTTFPPMLIASIFGINSEHTPVMGRSFDFWIVLGIMVFATLGIILFFHHKKWL
ncbi:MAG: magnesium transporter CorA family protein [Parcubacteria group bacterium]|nr:magnesium transporter CorA family protein [Parcubacteria group bacterium]